MRSSSSCRPGKSCQNIMNWSENLWTSKRSRYVCYDRPEFGRVIIFIVTLIKCKLEKDERMNVHLNLNPTHMFHWSFGQSGQDSLTRVFVSTGSSQKPQIQESGRLGKGCHAPLSQRPNLQPWGIPGTRSAPWNNVSSLLNIHIFKFFHRQQNY